MDLDSFQQLRFFRVVSHNGNSGSLKGKPSASNFTVALGDDISRVGEVAGFSLENITFPNVFPNISDTNRNNEFYMRLDLPNADSLQIFNGDFFHYSTPDGITHTLVYGGLHTTNTIDTVAALNLVFADVLVFSTDPNGAVFIQSLIGPVLLDDNFFSLALNIPADELASFGTAWVGYPVGIGYPFGDIFYTLIIPKGFYNQNQIATMLEGQLNAVVGDGSFVVSIVTVGADQLMQVTNAIHPFILSTRAPAPGKPVNYRQLGYQLGFQNLPMGVLSNTVTANLNPSLQGEQVVYLFSSMFSAGKKSFSGEGPQDDMIATIPIMAGYGEINEYTLNQWGPPAMAFERGVIPRVLDFSLKNQFDEYLDIGWNQTLSISFRLFFR